MVAKFAETVSFVAWQVVMALRWDDTLTADYALLFVPLYIALALRWLGRYLTMLQMASDVLRMTTPEILEHAMGKPYADLTEEEQEAVARDFIIVHLPPEAAIADVEDVVQLSPEYQASMQIYYNSFSSLVLGMLFGIPLVVMLVLKIDGHYDGSWWIVFVPVWVYLGVQILWNCYSCCCASVVGEEVVLQMSMADADEAGEEEKEDGEGEKKESSEPMFANPSSSVREFNKEQPDSEEKKETTKAATTTTPTPAPASKSEDKPDPDVVDTFAPNVVEEDDAPEIDEEDYAEYAEAFKQAEENAMETQAKSGSALCMLLFQLTIACLIVGKLEEDANGDKNEDDVGYNAIWILFPFLMIAGCILCIWACLIYGAGQEGLDNLVERAAGGGEDDEKEDDGDEESPPATTSPMYVPPAPKAAALAAAPTPTTKPAEEEQFYDDGLD
jgi:hypothetical protein